MGLLSLILLSAIFCPLNFAVHLKAKTRIPDNGGQLYMLRSVLAFDDVNLARKGYQNLIRSFNVDQPNLLQPDYGDIYVVGKIK